ncbi:MAG TPA: KTSC domain-containing protein [Kofleriaceae bacterium]|nr:KTSC domain-containing protein [Kofleriaceae bacterium]
MQRDPVESKTLRSIGYDAGAEVLEIEFASGRIYAYREVPASVHAWLMKVPSKTAFFSRKIRDLYPFRDITPPPDDTPLLDQLRASLQPRE